MGPDNTTSTCIDCTRMPVLSSPELWWFFGTNDPLMGHCLVVEETPLGALKLACQTQDPYTLQDGEYVVDATALVEMTPAELVERAIPLGVDQPSFTHPDTGEVVADTTSSRVRDVVLATWPKRAGAASPIDPSCGLDCAAEQRVMCLAGTSNCGPCLPGTAEFQGICYERREANSTDPLHDEEYGASGVTTAPMGSLSVDIPLTSATDISRVEVYLGTTNAGGDSDDTWALGAAFSYGVPSAPPHGFTLQGMQSDGAWVPIGDALSPGVVAQDSASQTDHALTYLFMPTAFIADITAVRLEVTSNSDVYGISVLEVRTFGRPSSP